MEKYGLIGRPLGHSFSAKFFSEKFEKEHVDAKYENFEIPEVKGYFMGLINSTPTLKGLNVTIPYKEEVLPYLDDLSDEAKAIGAVNVISVKHQSNGDVFLKGYNSDVIGFVNSIRPLIKPFHKKALILGTGGASKAIIYGLNKMGIMTTYVSRYSLNGNLTYEELSPEIINDYLVIVNCTPVGMFPHVDECPKIPYSLLSPKHLLYDLVYNPLDTQFLQKGRKYGCTTKNGLEMLHLQAIASWKFWHE